MYVGVYVRACVGVCVGMWMREGCVYMYAFDHNQCCIGEWRELEVLIDQDIHD